MADKDIVALTAATTPLTGAELVKVVQGGNSRKVSVTDVVAVSTGAMLKAVYDPNDDGIIAVAQGGSGSATAAGARTNFGLGTMAVQNAAAVAITGGSITGITDLAVADGGSGASDAAGARANFGLAIGTDVMAYSANLAGFAATTVANVQNRDNHTGTQLAATISDFSTAADLRVAAAVGVSVQAYDALLSSVSALSLTAGDIIYATGTDAVARLPVGAAGQVLAVNGSGAPAWDTSLVVGGLIAANNLSDVDDADTSLDNLGFGAAGKAIAADVTVADVRDYLGVTKDIATVAEATAYAPVAAPSIIRTGGHTTAGDGGGALYKKVASEPSHAGKFSITLSDAVTVVWYEIAERVLTERMFGAPGDGDWNGGGTDATAMLQAWASCPAAKVKRFTAASRITDGLVFNAGDTVDGDGASTGVDASAALSFPASNLISVSGSLVALPGLSGTANLGRSDFTMTDASGVAVGDVVLIFNPTDNSWSDWRPEYRAGEFTRVHSKSGNTVNITHQLYDTYAAASVSLYKLVGPSTTVRNFRVEPPKLEYKGGVKVSLIDTPVVENIYSMGGYYTGVELDRCVNFTLGGQGYKNFSPPNNDEYGATISNCQWGTVFGGFCGTRHALTLGGGASVGAVTNRAITVHASHMGNHFEVAGSDTHGNCEDITFIGGTFSNGATISGQNIRYIGCVLVGELLGGGCCVIAGEPRGGTHRFINCEFRAKANPNATSRGIIHLTNLSANVRTALTLDFRGSIMEVPAATTYPIRVEVGGALVDISIIVDGLEIIGGAGVTQLMRVSRTAGVSNFKLIRIKDVRGLVTGANFIFYSTAGIGANAYQLPEQYGEVTIAGNTGSAEAGTAVTYRNPYPVAPFVTCHNVASTIGGDQYTAIPKSEAATGFTATARTADNGVFASTASGAVRWIAKLDQAA